jgi:hypothetical protein
VAKREIKTALDKLQKGKLEKKRREALADQHYIFVILNERELLSAAKIALERESASEHFVLVGTQMLNVLVDQI